MIIIIIDERNPHFFLFFDVNMNGMATILFNVCGISCYLKMFIFCMNSDNLALCLELNIIFVH